MNHKDLNDTVKQLVSEIVSLRAETTRLREKVAELETSSPVPFLATQVSNRSVSTTRRRMLSRLATLLVAGTAAGTVVAAGSEKAEAKIVAGGEQIGAVITSKGDGTTGKLPGVYKYGLIALAGTGEYDISVFDNISRNDTAIFARTGSLGVGVYTSGGTTGVYAKGSKNAIECEGGQSGVVASGLANGVYATATGTGVNGEGYYGVQGVGFYGGYFNGGNLNQGGYGVYGVGSYGLYGTGHIGVYGTGDYYGVYGQSKSSFAGYAGYFQGKVLVTGQLSKPGGSFKIDHPLDPANKYLSHSFVESPDMLNIYNGIIQLDNQGQGEIQMPGWFETLNREFRYGLTCLGEYAPVYISQEIKEGKFKIAGGLPGQRVSWQITGIRQDKWAEAHRIPVEEDKPPEEKGKYLHPELFGQPPTLSVNPGVIPANGAK